MPAHLPGRPAGPDAGPDRALHASAGRGSPSCGGPSARTMGAGVPKRPRLRVPLHGEGELMSAPTARTNAKWKPEEHRATN